MIYAICIMLLANAAEQKVGTLVEVLVNNSVYVRIENDDNYYYIVGDIEIDNKKVTRGEFVKWFVDDKSKVSCVLFLDKQKYDAVVLAKFTRVGGQLNLNMDKSTETCK